MKQAKPISIEWASEQDLDWLIRHDPHLTRRVLREKIPRHEVLVARRGGELVGWLRYSLFWDTIPFIVLLFVLETHRGQHIGSGLVEHFERKMRGRRCRWVMTSSRSDEHSQHYWRKLGYSDIGGFMLPGEPFELLFLKEL